MGMEINRKNAMKFWEDTFGKTVQAVDFAGRKLQKGAYEQKTSDFGWCLTYIVPKTEGGTAKESNIICTHVKTAEEKGDLYPAFIANEIKYTIVNKDDKFVIEEATDSETLAEQQAKIKAAIDRWESYFGDAETAVDFCGRKMLKSEFGTDTEYAWKIAPYVTSKQIDNKNAYIANILSVEEALGKTAFKANGKNYTLNKENGAYYFKSLEQKPQKKAFEVTDVNDVTERIALCRANYDEQQNHGVWLDFAIVKIVTVPGATSAAAATIVDTVSMLMKEQVGDALAFEVSELVDEAGARYMFLTFRYAPADSDDLDRIFSGCMLLNTYAPILFRDLELEELKVYNYANCFDVAQAQYPIELLLECNLEFKSLMTSIYQSAYGFHDNESPVTVYVSSFIVQNVPMLYEMHPANETVYYTEAQMTEHNYVFTELRENIESFILNAISAQNEEQEPENAPAENTEPVSSDLDVSDFVPAAPAVAETVAEEAPSESVQAPAVAETAAEEAPSESVQAPAVAETAAEEAPSESVQAPAVAETVAEEAPSESVQAPAVAEITTLEELSKTTNTPEDNDTATQEEQTEVEEENNPNQLKLNIANAISTEPVTAPATKKNDEDSGGSILNRILMSYAQSTQTPTEKTDKSGDNPIETF